VSRCRADILVSTQRPLEKECRATRAVRSEDTDRQPITASEISETRRSTCLTTYTQPRRRALTLRRLCSTPLSFQRRHRRRLVVSVTEERSTNAIGRAVVGYSNARIMCNSTSARHTLSRSPTSAMIVLLKVSSPLSQGKAH
jgi:hypothetical protein